MLDGIHHFVRRVTLVREKVKSFEQYPFSIPAVRSLESLEIDPKITFLVGENGSGKSTLIEAIAVAAGFNAEGGSQNFHFATRPSESELHRYIRLVRGIVRPRTGYFLRAESFFNVASEVDRIPDALASHGGRSLHEQSHGESFMALVNNRFGSDGLYILDEPEAALSPTRQLKLLQVMHDRIEKESCQFIVATHSPILLGYPKALIYRLSERGIERTSYEETEHYTVTRDFLLNRDRYLRELFGDPEEVDELEEIAWLKEAQKRKR